MIDPYPNPDHPLPRPILLGAGALAVATILLAATARQTGVGAFHLTVAPPVVSRDLVFSDAPDGSLRVRNADGNDVTRVAPQDGGFVRAALRGLARNRVLHGQREDAPYRIGLGPDGQLWLQDLATRQTIDLRAFGPTNAAAFAAFLGGGEAPEPDRKT